MNAIEEVLWGDVLFAIDFSMDYLCLYFCLRIQRQPIHILHLCIGAAIGAAFGVANVAFGFVFTRISGMLFTLAAAFLCCYFALFACRRNILRVLATIPLFFVSEAALGGVMTAAYLWLGKTLGTQKIALNGQGNMFGLPFFLGMFILAILLFFVFHRVISAKRGQDIVNKDVRLLIKYNGHTAVFPCFFDSGNLAKEPISGEAVIFLPKSALSLFALTEDTLSRGNIKGSRLIPIQTVTNKELLWGIFPEEQYLIYSERSQRVSAYLVFSEIGKKDTAILPQTEHFMTFGY